ncbi:hypothetical protein J15TS10_28100 [Paenibacillus woosongensis]|uniref:Uncharacterized protein n=1 Tax=Paenibacillus woosongensis TaxID=307580 RepID=A0ABQ4MSM4_9BACL|nr:hypothetical protein J15TS10_28100 [Paenibacillus woosongensis]
MNPFRNLDVQILNDHGRRLSFLGFYSDYSCLDYGGKFSVEEQFNNESQESHGDRILGFLDSSGA